MSFDRLAPHYRWMEWVLAGSKLQRCRTTFLHHIPTPRSVLLVGEGNGRFLTEVRRSFPEAQITCLDASARMLDYARKNLEVSGISTDTVKFIHADICDWSPLPQQFDLIASHFFLDCFSEQQLNETISRLAAAGTPDACWLIADFNQPSKGWKKWRAGLILRSMYLYFRWATRLAASRLTPPDPFLQQQGFALRERKLSEWGLLRSDLWSRRPNIV